MKSNMTNKLKDNKLENRKLENNKLDLDHIENINRIKELLRLKVDTVLDRQRKYGNLTEEGLSYLKAINYYAVDIAQCHRQLVIVSNDLDKFFINEDYIITPSDELLMKSLKVTSAEEPTQEDNIHNEENYTQR